MTMRRGERQHFVRHTSRYFLAVRYGLLYVLLPDFSDRRSNMLLLPLLYMLYFPLVLSLLTFL